MREQVKLEVHDSRQSDGSTPRIAEVEVSRYVFGLPWVITVGAVGGLLVMDAGANHPIGVIGFALLIAYALGQVEKSRNPDALRIKAPPDRGPNEKLLVKGNWEPLKRFVEESAEKNREVLVEYVPRCSSNWILVAKRLLDDALVDYRVVKGTEARMVADKSPPYRMIEATDTGELDAKVGLLQRRGWQCAGDMRTETREKKTVYRQEMVLA